jgi:hypothetical protein
MNQLLPLTLSHRRLPTIYRMLCMCGMAVLSTPGCSRSSTWIHDNDHLSRPSTAGLYDLYAFPGQDGRCLPGFFIHMGEIQGMSSHLSLFYMS